MVPHVLGVHGYEGGDLAVGPGQVGDGHEGGHRLGGLVAFAEGAVGEALLSQGVDVPGVGGIG